MDLSGTWRAAIADDDLRRSYPDADFDDGGWEPIEVPGHWRSVPAFADEDGPILHRRQFSASAPGPGRRSWLTFGGVFYQTDVWLDGAYLGDTEGYFQPHTFEVTEALRETADHVLAVEVACSPQRDRTAKRNLTGLFQHWESGDAEWNPGGIWRPVTVSSTGPVRISTLRVLCVEATAERAIVQMHADVDAAHPTAVTIDTLAGSADTTTEHTLAAGANSLTWRITVDRPALWWPHALGSPDLVDVDVAVRIGDEVSDRRAVTSGLRRVELKRWVLHVNGERLFTKGIHAAPARLALADAGADLITADVQAAKRAGLDLLRVYGHIGRPELYDAADREGVLVWQDLPLHLGYARTIRKQARRQAAAAVDVLSHHPSLALWCAHDEPFAVDVPPGADEATLRRGRIRRMVGQQLPTWNKTVLDASLKRALERRDPTRPVVAHSGVLPHIGGLGTDTHPTFGWERGDERDLAGLWAAFPRLSRFVCDTGASSPPVPPAGLITDDELEDWPQVDWERVAVRHGFQGVYFERNGLAPAQFDSYDAWCVAAQAHQADVLRHTIESLRRIKYRPTGGFVHSVLADAHPAVSPALLDTWRNPKAGWDALAAACAPVIVTADWPEAAYAPGAALALDVHVVSDLRVPVERATVTARLRWSGGEHTWTWEGGADADACVRVGMIRALVPNAPGPLRLDLALESAQVKAAATYSSSIAG